MDKWQRVFSDRQGYRAEIVKAVLEDAGLQPVLVNKKDSSYQFGYFEVFVSPDHVMKSIRIIADDIKFE